VTSLKPNAVSHTHQKTDRLQDGPKKQTQRIWTCKISHLGRADKHSNISSRTAIFCIFTAAGTDVCAYRYLCPFHPSLQRHHNLPLVPKNGSADVAPAESACPSKQAAMHRAHNPCSPSQTRSGVFMPTCQAPKPPNSCTATAGGER